MDLLDPEPGVLRDERYEARRELVQLRRRPHASSAGARLVRRQHARRWSAFAPERTTAKPRLLSGTVVLPRGVTAGTEDVVKLAAGARVVIEHGGSLVINANMIEARASRCNAPTEDIVKCAAGARVVIEHRGSLIINANMIKPVPRGVTAGTEDVVKFAAGARVVIGHGGALIINANIIEARKGVVIDGSGDRRG